MNTPVSLIGVPQATLQSWLTQAQQALQNVATGAKVTTVTYAQGEGSRSVSYSRANIADLRAWITELQTALGVRTTRRAIGVMFR